MFTLLYNPSPELLCFVKLKFFTHHTKIPRLFLFPQSLATTTVLSVFMHWTTLDTLSYISGIILNVPFVTDFSLMPQVSLMWQHVPGFLSFLKTNNIPLCVFLHFLYTFCPLIDVWVLSPLHYCEQFCNGRRCADFSLRPYFYFFGINTCKWDCWVVWKFYFYFLKEPPCCFPQHLHHFTFPLAMHKGPKRQYIVARNKHMTISILNPRFAFVTTSSTQECILLSHHYGRHQGCSWKRREMGSRTGIRQFPSFLSYTFSGQGGHCSSAGLNKYSNVSSGKDRGFQLYALPLLPGGNRGIPFSVVDVGISSAATR